ncbi:hypothetical protein CHCC14814_0966 [Bacillus paralicheniformis]|nr:hypothetical protein CHCC14814_0966 [Bacillus paralicheniformis]
MLAILTFIQRSFLPKDREIDAIQSEDLARSFFFRPIDGVYLLKKGNRTKKEKEMEDI